MLALEGEAFQPLVWDRARGASSPVKLPQGKIVADNSELRWSPDGRRLFLNLRPEAWRAEAARRFRE